jgi:asparagine synthase (glutamine-hydrolysing)
MCGIAGFFNPKQALMDPLGALAKMANAISHRGPDDYGHWLDLDSGIALGHRRLSILDLSPAGHQPMHSASGRYVIVFNGEIYNFQQLRHEIEERAGHLSWRGHSDTEVMLAAFEAWGVENAVKRFVGMFAFTLWDRKERLLHMVRDRLGEKPLYYGWMGKTLLFASELKALHAHPEFNSEINRDALALYMRHNCIPAPHTIYKKVYKLMPGTVLTIMSNGEPGQMPPPKPYWQAEKIAEFGVSTPYLGSEAEAVNDLDKLLRDVISKQMVADVPLGVFLSGGIDSSTVAALMQAQSVRPVKTFTIGFSEDGYNEAEHAKKIAQHLNTEHTELYLTPEDALAVIPRLPALYDEPFSDSSQIPTFLISQLARNHVTVSLSGDGGDEIFAGYNRHYWLGGIWDTACRFPTGLRMLVAGSLLAISPQRWNSLYSWISLLLPARYHVPVPGHSLHKLANVLSAESPEEIYYLLISHWRDPASLVIGASEPSTVITDRKSWPKLQNFTQEMMYLDLVTYLPDDILVKVDRAGMGVSLESRMPFLDHRLVEFAWQLPLTMKIQKSFGKWILRQVLAKYVPRELFERPKSGFGVPIDSWLRGPLREWAETLLNEGRLRSEGFFNSAPIRDKWKEHLSGKYNWQYHLWDVLMFQAWLEVQKTHS